jgi:ribonuclease HI
MPWRASILRGTRVFARSDPRGEFNADIRRVEIRNKPKDGKPYRAALGNLEASDDAILPDSHCSDGSGAPASSPLGAKASAAGKSRSRGGKPSGTPGPVPDNAVVAYTDGACSGNPGPSGLGVVLTDGDSRRELSEFLGHGTNNIAELSGILRALEAVGAEDRPFLVHTDSQYAIGVLTKGWKAKANQELIASIKKTMQPFGDLRFVYVKGHAGIPLNERADTLAREAVESRGGGEWVAVSVCDP